MIMSKEAITSGIIFILYTILSPIGIKVILQNMTFNTATVIVFGTLTVTVMYCLAYTMTILYKAVVDVYVYNIFRNTNIPDVNNIHSFKDKARCSILELEISIKECKIRIRLLYASIIITIIYSTVLMQIIMHNVPITIGTVISMLAACIEFVIMIRINLMLKKHKELMNTARSGIYLLYTEMDEQDEK